MSPTATPSSSSPRSLPRPVIDSLSKCRIISRLGNGTDKIDVQRATERGIVVSNVPHFCLDEMSDHVMAMVLSLSRPIAWMSRYMHEGAYRRARAEALQLPRLATARPWASSASAPVERRWRVAPALSA